MPPKRRDRAESNSSNGGGGGNSSNNNSNPLRVPGSNMGTGMHPYFGIHGVQPAPQQGSNTQTSNRNNAQQQLIEDDDVFIESLSNQRSLTASFNNSQNMQFGHNAAGSGGRAPPPPPPPPRTRGGTASSSSVASSSARGFGGFNSTQNSNAPSSSAFAGGGGGGGGGSRTTNAFIRHQTGGQDMGLGGLGGDHDEDGNDTVAPAPITPDESVGVQDHFAGIILRTLFRAAATASANESTLNNLDLTTWVGSFRSRADAEAGKRVRATNPLLARATQQSNGANTTSSSAADAFEGLALAPDTHNTRHPVQVEMDLLKLFAAAPSLSTPMAQQTESALKTVAGEIANMAEHVTGELLEFYTLCLMRGPDKSNSIGPVAEDGVTSVFTGCLLSFWQTLLMEREEEIERYCAAKQNLELQIAMLREKHGAANDGVLVGGGGRGASSSASSAGGGSTVVQTHDARLQQQLQENLDLLTSTGPPPPYPYGFEVVPFVVCWLEPYRSLRNICLRPTHVPPCFTVASHDLSFTRHQGKLVQIKGTVVKSTSVRLVVYRTTFVCPTCNDEKELATGLATRQQALPRPTCSNCKKDRTKMVTKSDSLKDYAECWIQRQGFGDDASLDDDALFGLDPMAQLQLGENDDDDKGGGKGSNNGSLGFSAKLPRSILVALEDQLTRVVYPGLTVEITGVCVARWANLMQGQTPEVTLMVNALNVQPVSAAQLSQQNPSSISAKQQALLMMARRYMKLAKRGGGGLLPRSSSSAPMTPIGGSVNRDSNSLDFGAGGGDAAAGHNNNNNDSAEDRRVKEMQLLVRDQESEAQLHARLDTLPLVSLLLRIESRYGRDMDGCVLDSPYNRKRDGPEGRKTLDSVFVETADMRQWINEFIDARFLSDPNLQEESQNSVRDDQAAKRSGHAAADAALESKLLFTRALFRTKLVQSVAPQLCGRFAERLSVLLTCVGGVRRRGGGGGGGKQEHYSLETPSDSNTTADGNTNTTTTQQTTTNTALLQPPEGGGSGGGGPTTRSNIHLLFVGDPSTGKSQLLLAANQIALTGVYALGVGTTSAGLTAAASKESGEWTLEPGALVLSNGGVCVIDELRTVSAADRNSLHEAMEQQSISIAKAGMCATLRTDCSVIAACNPVHKGGGKRGSKPTYDPTASREIEVGVGAPLLSRFDLIFTMFDNTRHDDCIAAHILALNTVSDELLGIVDDDNNNGQQQQQHEAGSVAEAMSESAARLGSGSAQAFTTKQLRDYASMCRQRCHHLPNIMFVDRPVGGGTSSTDPTQSTNKNNKDAENNNNNNNNGAFSQSDLCLNDDAADLINAYYNMQRLRSVEQQRGSYQLADAILVTIRLLESLVRIAQAHAALVGRAEVVEMEDAAMAIFLTEQSARSLDLMMFPPLVNPQTNEDYTYKVMRAKTERERELVLGELEDLELQIQATMPRTSSNGDRWFLNAGVPFEYAQGRILNRIAEIVLEQGGVAIQRMSQTPRQQSLAAGGGMMQSGSHQPSSSRGVSFQQQQQQKNNNFALQMGMLDDDDFDPHSNDYDVDVEKLLQRGQHEQEADDQMRILTQFGGGSASRGNRTGSSGASSVVPGGYTEMRPSHQQHHHQQQQRQQSMQMTQLSQLSNTTTSRALLLPGQQQQQQHQNQQQQKSPSPHLSQGSNNNNNNNNKTATIVHVDAAARAAAGANINGIGLLERERVTVVMPEEFQQQQGMQRDAETRRRMNETMTRGGGGGVIGTPSGASSSSNNNNNSNVASPLTDTPLGTGGVSRRLGSGSGGSGSGSGSGSLEFLDSFKNQSKEDLHANLKERSNNNSSGSLKPQ